jgi:hypothetical protein
MSPLTPVVTFSSRPVFAPFFPFELFSSGMNFAFGL